MNTIADHTTKKFEQIVSQNQSLAKGVAGFIHVSNSVLGRGSPIDEIIDGFLWLGNLYAASDEKTMTDRGITHILGITQFGEVAKFLDENKFVYKIIVIHDEAHCDLGQYFDDSFSFIQSCLRDSGRIFVHCNQGRSRSATIVTAYLMRVNKWSFLQALGYLQSRRPSCNPNEGFVEQLIKYEHDLSSFFGWDDQPDKMEKKHQHNDTEQNQEEKNQFNEQMDLPKVEILNLENENKKKVYSHYFKVANISGSGYLEPSEAHFFLKSGLPQEDLKIIWDLVSFGQNRIDREKFDIALQLIALAQNGHKPTLENVNLVQNLPLPIFQGISLPK